MDRAAFTALYEESRDDVYAYTAGLLRDRSAAEEVTATAFERAWRRRRTFKPGRGSARGWVFGIARNAALDELRRRKRHAELGDGVIDPLSPDPESGAALSLERVALRQALTTLEPRDRELIALKHFAGLRNTEIALAVGISESAVGTRLHRATEQLRRSFDESH